MKPIHFAFTGLGAIAKTHIVALRAMPVIQKASFVPVLNTLITRNPDANREQALAMGFQKVTSDLTEALENPSVHIVDICTPNAMHFAEGTAASAAGNAIYFEKPLTETYSRTEELVSHISANTLQQVALVYRYHPAVMRMKAILQEGIIGDVLQCNCSYLRSGYLNAERPVSWRLNDTLSGGGAITDLGIHVIDLIAHLFGELTDVHGETNIFVKERPKTQGSDERVQMTVDDWASFFYTTKSGVRGTGEVSRIAWGSDRFSVQIVGARGSITCDLEKDITPRVSMLSGATPELPVPSSLQLIPNDKTTMGVFVDSHFGALNHFLHRYIGEDLWANEGLAPTMKDAAHAEMWIDQILRSKA
ncbi:Gfo/Idh/MocA family oxidoreductase [Paenibacillus terrigena]|uniref:Gfo/Idh/MocA family protein n=1 Tax=Paenibacillus terrigena TaxID=369333 RepID=UPI0028D1B27F|nr:Gfo/Idh/MocA family oxidoreductase [Paenibacillus terrigena]